MDVETILKEDLRAGRIPEKYVRYIRQFYEAALALRKERQLPLEPMRPIFELYRKLVIDAVRSPYKFGEFHRRIQKPVNLTKFGLQFFELVIYKERSKAHGLEHVAQMVEQLKAGHNVILMANHQTEADPQAIGLLLQETPYAAFSDEIIFVAGDPVRTDPMCIPFSLGRNLLCIYSKKRMEGSLIERAEKKAHNARVMRVAFKLLGEGGWTILVFPSGGRDRPGPDGLIDVAPFDAGSVEMFRLLGAKAPKPCHFYPLALATYDILPPPNSVGGEIGEERYSKGGTIHISFGAELDLKGYPGCNLKDKDERRNQLARYTWQSVRDLYHALPLPKRI